MPELLLLVLITVFQLIYPFDRRKATKTPIDFDGSKRVLMCGWRDSQAEEYPLQLVDKHQCVKTVLSYLYANAVPKMRKTKTSERDAKIYALHTQGVLNDVIAKQFKLSEKHIQRIIRIAQRAGLKAI